MMINSDNYDKKFLKIISLSNMNCRSGNDSSEEFFDFDENDLEELIEDKYVLYIKLFKLFIYFSFLLF